MTPSRRYAVFIGLLIVSLTIDNVGHAAEPSGQRCAGCHSDIEPQTARATPSTLHASSVPCEACHGDATAHAASNGITPVASAQPRCTPCHEQVAPHSRWKGSAHERAGLQCASCHSIHAGGQRHLLKGSSESETCFACHAEVRHARTQRSTHLFRDDQGRPKLECSSCHDAHGTASDSLLVAASLNDVCYSCHDDKRGPFLWEHAPVRENCATCHEPHGSNNTRLLVMRQPMLCHTCHTGDMHVSAPGGARTAQEMNRSCVNCHQVIHGSNHPSGITLQR